MLQNSITFLKLTFPLFFVKAFADSAVRAGLQAISAAYALAVIGCFKWLNAHFAGFAAQRAGNTFLIHTKPIKADGVEKPIYRAQRTDIFAERTVYDDRKQNYAHK